RQSSRESFSPSCGRCSRLPRAANTNRRNRRRRHRRKYRCQVRSGLRPSYDGVQDRTCPSRPPCFGADYGAGHGRCLSVDNRRRHAHTWSAHAYLLQTSAPCGGLIPRRRVPTSSKNYTPAAAAAKGLSSRLNTFGRGVSLFLQLLVCVKRKNTYIDTDD